MTWSIARLTLGLTVTVGLIFAIWSLAVSSPHSPWYQSRWENVGEGDLERMEFVSASGVNVLLYRFDPMAYEFRVENASVPARVRAWASEVHGERIIFNGFYFLEDYAPAGLLITGGESIGTQVFDYDKSGVVRLQPNFEIIDTDTVTFSQVGVLEAGQSYPFLLKQGQPAIAEDSGLKARRTFIATDAAGLAYIGVVWKDDVSLFELTKVLQEVEVNWLDALNLDGGPSTGIAVETASFAEVLDSAAPVPNVIVVEAR